jgi:hypothetical protein
MFDPIEITVTGIAYPETGLLVDCAWRWGIRPPQEARLRLAKGVTELEDVREAIVQSVLAIAEAEDKRSPFDHALMGERLRIDSERDADTFNSTRTEIATIFLLRKAEAKHRPREIIVEYQRSEATRESDSPRS